MNSGCVKSEEEFDTKYNFDVYQSTYNNAPKTESPIVYPIECFKVESPISIKLEPDPLTLKTENEFPKSDAFPNGLENMLINFNTKQRICLSAEAQSICLNVYHNLKQIESLMHTEAVEKTSLLCGISRTSMFNLLRRGAKDRQKRSDAGSCKLPTLFTEDLETIKKRVRDYYVSDDDPKILGLRLKLRESNPKLQISEKSFGKWLKDTGFRTQRIKNRNVLLENGKFVKQETFL